MQKISDLYLLVHPDHQARRDYQHPLHPYQQELRIAWERKVKEIRNDPEAALFYVSPLSALALSRGLQDHRSLSFDLDRKEIQRIERWKDTLEERMVVFPERRFRRRDVMNALKGFYFNEDELTLRAFGEYEDFCVRVWRDDLRDHLGLQPESAITLDNLSLSKERGDMIKYSRSLERY